MIEILGCFDPSVRGIPFADVLSLGGSFRMICEVVEEENTLIDQRREKRRRARAEGEGNGGTRRGRTVRKRAEQAARHLFFLFLPPSLSLSLDSAERDDMRATRKKGQRTRKTVPWEIQIILREFPSLSLSTLPPRLCDFVFCTVLSSEPTLVNDFSPRYSVLSFTRTASFGRLSVDILLISLSRSRFPWGLPLELSRSLASSQMGTNGRK